MAGKKLFGVVACVLLVLASGNGGSLAGYAFDTVMSMPVGDRFQLLADVSRGLGCLACVASSSMAAERWRTLPLDKMRISIHESGHAIAILEAEKSGVFEFRGAKLSLGNPFQSGATLNKIKRKVLEARDLKQLLVVALAGRAAEHEVFGSPSASAAGDLEMAHAIARIYRELFGLDDLTSSKRLVRRAYYEARCMIRAKQNELKALCANLYAKEAVSPSRARKLYEAASKREVRTTSRWRSLVNAVTGAKTIEPPPIPKRTKKILVGEIFGLAASLTGQWCFFSVVANLFERGASGSSTSSFLPVPSSSSSSEKSSSGGALGGLFRRLPSIE